MIGQEKLLTQLNSFSVDTFPKSSLIIGGKGMGKHTLSKYIQENILKFPLVDITANISAELIDNIYRSSNPAVYLIDLSEMMEREQNIILKFVEEPLNNAFIILLAENKNRILNTVVNRCVCFELVPYSDAELLNFVEKNEDAAAILKMLRSPGKIRTTSLKNLNDMQELCDKMIHKMKQATIANTLSITLKINFKDEYSKFDFYIFLDLLESLMFDDYLKTNNIETFTMYKTLREQRDLLGDKRLNKEVFFQHLLINLWKISRKEI